MARPRGGVGSGFSRDFPGSGSPSFAALRALSNEGGRRRPTLPLPAALRPAAQGAVSSAVGSLSSGRFPR